MMVKFKKKLKRKGKKIIKKFLKKKNANVVFNSPTFTIKKLCKIFDAEVPDKLKSIENKKLKHLTFDDSEIEEGGIFFAEYYFTPKEEYYKKITKNNPAVIFIPMDYYEQYIPEGDYLIIPVDDLFEKQGKFISKYLKKYKVKTLAITGSIGKTTTKQLLNCVVSNEGLTFCHKGNYNTYRTISDTILYKLSKFYDYYIQEVAAFSPRAVERSAAMLNVDAYILTNIYPHHLNMYKTVERVLEDKSSLSKYIKPGGVAVVNYDDDLIASHDFGHEIITFGIETDRKVDYRAINIVQNNEFLEFDVIDKENNSTHLVVNIVGKHNVYNIIAVYALSKWLGFKDENIKKNLLKFETTGIRQNIVNVAGINVYLDCYNVAFQSIVADIKTLEEIKIPKGNKRIAILAPENKLGDKYKEKIYEFGKQLKDVKVDHIICYSMSDENFEYSEDYYGLNSRPLYESLKDVGFKNVYNIDNPDELMKKVKELCKPGDVVLLKANWELELPMAFDKLYGSSISVDYDRKSKMLVNDIFKDDNFEYETNDVFKEALIIKYIGSDKQMNNLVIPDKIKSYPVFKIMDKLFRNDKRIESIDFGKSIVHIGTLCFSGTNVKKLNIPSNVKYISKSAFSNCQKLEEVKIAEGCLHIDSKAFYNCTKLKNVYLPSSLQYISSDAFLDSPDVVICCKKNTYSYNFAKENNIRFKIIK